MKLELEAWLQLELILGLVVGFVLGRELEFVPVLGFRLVLRLRPRSRLGLELEVDLQELQLSLGQLLWFLEHLPRFPREESEQQVKQGGLEPKAEHLPNSPVEQSPVPKKKKKHIYGIVHHLIQTLFTPKSPNACPACTTPTVKIDCHPSITDFP